ncbi:MAG: glycoside hydrolase family 19 protein [Hyphomicrobium sp.]|nr:glycoside hydrolase family 19 protein [Hyphomicrobium sp.]
MPTPVSRADLARMFPRALPEWLDALATLGPVLAKHYAFTRLDWVHLMGQIDAETNGLRLARMAENMNFRSAKRILEVYRYRLGVALDREPELRARFGTREALAAHLVGKPKELADLVYGGREGTPWRQGSRYIGRGPTQITHRDNYAAIGTEIAKQPGGAGIDLVAAPERLADDPALGIRSAFADWHLKGLSRWARADDVDTLSDALNTGNIRDGVKPHGLDRRRGGTARAKRIWPGVIDFDVAPVPAEPPLVARTPVPVPTPPATMLESKTGNAAVAMGAGGALGAATEISNAVTKMTESGDVSALAFALALARSPTFWVSVLTVAGCAFVWLDRRFKLNTFGV